MRLLTFRSAVFAVSTLAFAGVPGLAGAQDHGDKHQDQQDKHKDHKQKKDDHQQAKEQEQQARQQEQQQQQAAQAAQQQQRAQAQQAEAQRAQQRVNPPPVRWQRDERVDVQRARLSSERQQQLIQLQQARAQEYSARLEQQQRVADEQVAALQRENRMAQYRYQQEYVARLREQQSHLATLRSYDYNNDPYFYTAPSYRYYRAGRTYQTNRYGADLLRQAVNNGYAQGVQAGQADRQDGYRRGYQRSYAYEDANYGYTGMYVDRNDYNYYFRQGFQRGYQDGYSARFQYGRNNNGTAGILANVLSTILNLQPLR